MPKSGSTFERVIRLRGLFSLPTGHPVFDQIADKIGSLSPEAARGISEAYNIISGARLLLASMSSDTFLQLPDQVQVTRIIVMADMFTPEIEGMRRTVSLLDRLTGNIIIRLGVLHGKISLSPRLSD